MSQPQYQTVFHIGLRSFPWSFMIAFIFLIAIGCVMIRFNGGKQIRLGVGYLVLILSSFMIVLANLVLIPKFYESRRAYSSGDSSIVEGTVEDFQPMPALGVAEESFSVNGTKFSYNVFDPTPCFHDLSPHRGPIRLGLDVRIYYKGSCIQRVDVRR
jgi:hypothetical protein